MHASWQVLIVVLSSALTLLASSLIATRRQKFEQAERLAKDGAETLRREQDRVERVQRDMRERRERKRRSDQERQERERRELDAALADYAACAFSLFRIGIEASNTIEHHEQASTELNPFKGKTEWTLEEVHRAEVIKSQVDEQYQQLKAIFGEFGKQQDRLIAAQTRLLSLDRDEVRRGFIRDFTYRLIEARGVEWSGTIQGVKANIDVLHNELVRLMIANYGVEEIEKIIAEQNETSDEGSTSNGDNQPGCSDGGPEKSD